MLTRLAAVLLAGGLLAGCTSSAAEPTPPAAAPSTEAAAPGPVTGLRVALEHTEEPAGGGRVSWRSTWRLSWTAVPGATGYAVWYGTSEGAPGAPREVQPETSLAVEAAAGTSPRARLQQDRAAGLVLTSSQLLVAVAAQGAGGPGPRTPWFPVGDVPAGGVPIGTADLGHGGHGH